MLRILSLVLIATAMMPGVAGAQPTSGIDTTHFDRSVRPQDDFYRFVNGTWLARTEIPADKSNYGSFTELADKAEVDLRALIEEAARATDRPEGSDVQKIGDFYRSFMDTVRIEALGRSPLDAELTRLADVDGRDALVAYLGYSRRLGIGAPFGFYVSADARQADRYALYVSQAGLGLPDRDYYFDDRFASVREQYAAYIARLLALAGWPDGAAAAETILALETRLAEHHWTRVRNRDRNATYNKLSLAEAARLTPNLDWAAFFDAAGVASVDSIIVRQPSFFEAMDALYAETPVEDWKTYLAFQLVDGAAPYLSRDFVETHFDFHGRTLSGVEALQPRWKRAVATMDDAMGELIGKEYVARHFRPEAKERMDQLVRNLRDAFARSIDELDWMDDATKAEARAKLAAFTFKIGYPDVWTDYTALVVRPDDLLGNLRRAAAFAYDRRVKRLGQPVDRDEWFMTPQTVNAYYSSTMNEVVFPAAILQPPFFNLEADDAVNYGAIGAVIGHEFSHGFDDQGRKSDGSGNLRDWWSPSSADEFQRRAGKLVAQYDGYRPLEGMNVNGQLTLGENIGDLAGLTMAYRAYRLSLGGGEAPVIDGLTGDQRFFMGWAQSWRRKYRDDELRRRLLTDSHSPSEYRTNGIVANMTPFYEAFDVQEGDALYRAPEERVSIW